METYSDIVMWQDCYQVSFGNAPFWYLKLCAKCMRIEFAGAADVAEMLCCIWWIVQNTHSGSDQKDKQIVSNSPVLSSLAGYSFVFIYFSPKQVPRSARRTLYLKTMNTFLSLLKNFKTKSFVSFLRKKFNCSQVRILCASFQAVATSCCQVLNP